MWIWLKEELSVKRFSLRLEDATMLTGSAVLPKLAFLFLRLAITIFCVVYIILSGFYDANGETKWFIYLTNWSFLILTIAFILLSVLSLCKTYQVYRTKPTADDYGTFETSVEAARKQEEIELPSRQHTEITISQSTSCKWYHQVTWLIYNISFCAAIIVSVSYWMFQAVNVEFIDVVTHALNSVFVLIEVFLGRIPIRLLHALYTVIYLAVYVIFTVIYWQAGGRNSRDKPYIYKILDYDNKNAGLIVGLILSLVVIAPPVIQLILLGLYKLRRRWFNHGDFSV